MKILSRPAIFLDRDGVIIENRHDYVRSWADVEIFPQAVEALVAAQSSVYSIVLVTNQSAVGRGFITLETAATINSRLLAALRQVGARVDAVYMCPHAPEDGCLCRKPLPGMLLQAAQELNLDLGNSVMIGDALTDIQAGHAAGVSQALLVRTGRGREQERLSLTIDQPPFAVFDTLSAALGFLIKSPP